MNTSTSNSICHSFVHHKNFLQKRVQESLFMEPTSPSEAYNALAGLKTGNSSGLDNIPSFLSKTAAVVIAPTLSYFINLSYELGLFPDSMKEAKIIPVFKTGNKLLMSNYRPISILSSFSKIFEKCIYQRWSPRGQILKSLALALASRPQVLGNWPVLGSRTAVFFELLKFCGALEKCFGKRFFVEIA